ncbi:PDDEXK-like family protein [Hymenobacter metallilatus]|uniref:PDDEXK-like family protein n=1 Tax=Hymenobacter metallilatus TaxID=2493666 RepID=UPI00163AC429|nr:PD-(D/E)XK nuclease family protein [Hymenobacter metallilatus]
MEHENRLVNQYTARDFTPFRFMAWSEVPSTHMLAFFLNPDETHGQGPLFQDIFLQHLRQLPVVGPRLPHARWKVEAERRHGELGQIDLLLTTIDRSFSICIENKPRDQTIDQYRQLKRYRKILRGRHQEGYLLLYLSRKKRNPDKESLRPRLRRALKTSGHYANITYESFILPLIDAWQQAVYPEALRTFLRHFRYQIEQWLNLPSTKPTQLMLEQEVVDKLATSGEHVRAAITVARSIEQLKRTLREKLVNSLADPAIGLVGEEHWEWNGHLDGRHSKPYLLRRVTADTAPACWPWGRFSICVEFDQGRLFYGIRFDLSNWYKGDASQAAWPAGTSEQLAGEFAGEPSGRPTEWWPWWRWAGPETEQDLYASIADSSLVKTLQQEVQRLVKVLDQFTATIELQETAATKLPIA